MNITDRYHYLKGQADHAQQQLVDAEINQQLYTEQLEALQTVGWLLTEAAILTQQRLKAAYEHTITAALNAVFDRPHHFELVFDRRGNRLDCQALVRTDGGMLLDPKSEKGGSVVDIISFVARVAEWVLGGRRSRPIFFLDEPFKNLGTSSGRLENAIKVMHDLADAFELQLIIITHLDQLAVLADSHHVMQHNGDYTTVTGRPTQEGVSRNVKKTKVDTGPDAATDRHTVRVR